MDDYDVELEYQLCRKCGKPIISASPDDEMCEDCWIDEQAYLNDLAYELEREGHLFFDKEE